MNHHYNIQIQAFINEVRHLRSIFLHRIEWKTKIFNFQDSILCRLISQGISDSSRGAPKFNI